jgi:hypothetical protein
MWWILGLLIAVAIISTVAAIIKFGSSTVDHDFDGSKLDPRWVWSKKTPIEDEDDYMMGDDYTDWGDKR